MKALRLSNKGFKVGNGVFGRHGARTGSVKQIVHDGDTVNIRLTDNLSVRFLGIDSAEVSFPLPGSRSFVQLSDARWDKFFTSGAWRTGAHLSSGLLHDLETRIQDGLDLAANHARHAANAEKMLERIIREDLDKSGKTAAKFVFFMAFGHEFLDGTGRLLCYLNSATENYEDAATAQAVSKLSYNERQLASGAAYPYFIWPNIQPFLNNRPFSPANIEPKAFWKIVRDSSKLKSARKSVAAARAAGIGIFRPDDPLQLAPFELRFLSRHNPPNRLVIDLAQPNSNRLLTPELYFTIPNPEDRLFVPEEYRLIFEGVGWKVDEGR